MPLHIYGQYRQHDQVMIVGDKESLLDLAIAIQNAIGSPDEKFSCSQFAGDGEQYEIAVKWQSGNPWDILRLPYSDPEARKSER